MLTAECVANDHGSYLAITVHGDPAGPRVNLVDIVAQQSKAYLSAAPKK
jgi:hypothetical protein